MFSLERTSPHDHILSTHREGRRVFDGCATWRKQAALDWNPYYSDAPLPGYGAAFVNKAV